MKTWIKATLIVILFGSQALMWGRVIWPPAQSMPQPGPGLLPFFYFLGLMEAITFGVGIAFILLIYASVFSVQKKYRTRAVLSSLSLFWLLTSWWLHDHLHAHNGDDLHGLIVIEYAFHLTSMIAALILTENFLFIMKKIKAVSTED